MDRVEQGFDMETKETVEEEKVIVMEKPRRKPYAVWEVGGQEYKLKLTAAVICKLEAKYGKNLLNLLTEDGLPPIGVMLTVVQASMQLYNHGVTFLKVQDLYDQYIAGGADQTQFYADVLMPLLAVSGFFTPTQAEILTEEIKSIDSSL